MVEIVERFSVAYKYVEVDIHLELDARIAEKGMDEVDQIHGQFVISASLLCDDAHSFSRFFPFP